jgi:hypothetical protein
MGQGRGGVVLPVRSVDGFWEEPFTFTGVTPPPVIPAETDFDMFNTLIRPAIFKSALMREFSSTAGIHATSPASMFCQTQKRSAGSGCVHRGYDLWNMRFN